MEFEVAEVHYFGDDEVGCLNIKHFVLNKKCELDLVTNQLAAHHLAKHQIVPLREMGKMKRKCKLNLSPIKVLRRHRERAP